MCQTNNELVSGGDLDLLYAKQTAVQCFVVIQASLVPNKQCISNDSSPGGHLRTSTTSAEGTRQPSYPHPYPTPSPSPDYVQKVSIQTHHPSHPHSYHTIRSRKLSPDPTSIPFPSLSHHQLQSLSIRFYRDIIPVKRSCP